MLFVFARVLICRIKPRRTSMRQKVYRRALKLCSIAWFCTVFGCQRCVLHTTTFPNLQFFGVPTSLPRNNTVQGKLLCLQWVFVTIFAMLSVLLYVIYQMESRFSLELMDFLCCKSAHMTHACLDNDINIVNDIYAFIYTYVLCS